MINKINGLIAATFSPIDTQGNINSKIISTYAIKLKKDGLAGVFICGTTGEGMSLSINERKLIAEEWVKYQDNNFKIIIHVGTTSIKQSSELAKHAQNIGAYGVSAMGPLFLKPRDIKDLIEFCNEIAKSSPELPFFYYHIPSISNVNFSMVEFINIAKLKINNFQGIKYSHNDIIELEKCVNIDNGMWNILFGLDEMFLSGLNIGVTGFVGSSYNFTGKFVNSIIDAFKLGELEKARNKQSLLVKSIDKINSYDGPIVSGKKIMKLIGLDCGDCRLPLSNLKEMDLINLEKDIKRNDWDQLFQ